MSQYPILQTKLYIPPIRPELVSRPRLIEQLNAGLPTRGAFPRALTLISAPAGFGKTTLLGEWVTQFQDRAAWLSLDREDNDEARFWTYLIAALQTLQADLGQDASQLLQAPQQPAPQTILTMLLNEVAALPQEAILVLDDCHLISGPAIHKGLAFLLEHLPPQMHVAISTRADPPLPIHRLRARGHLTELRSDDLRFSTDEAAVFLNAAMGLDLAREDIEVLEARTEGWIVGLQLAALSLQGRSDAHEFITAFSGGHHYVLEYLTQEVVRRQPEPVQRFLIQTSILDRLCGPLCDAVQSGSAKLPSTADADAVCFGQAVAAGNSDETAVRLGEAESSTGESNGEAMLAHLRQRNLFILPLDDEHRWYRYHHLFADLLGNLLQKDQPPERIQELHLRACEWYEGNGLIPEAVNHALAAADFQRASELIERTAWAMLMRGEVTTLLHWLDSLPDGVVCSRSELVILHAWALALTGQLDDADSRLSSVNVRYGRGEVAAVRGYVASHRGEAVEAIERCQEALRLLPKEQWFPRGVAAVILGTTPLRMGNPVAASQALAGAVGLGQTMSQDYLTMIATTALGEAQEMQGLLRQAVQTFGEALQLASEHSTEPVPFAGMTYIGLAGPLYERNDLDEAMRCVTKGIELSKQARNIDTLEDGYLNLALLHRALGNPAAALEVIQEVESAAQRGGHSDWLAIACAIRSQWWLQEGNIAAASRRAQESRLRARDEADFVREFGEIAMARVLVVRALSGGVTQSDEASQALRSLAGLLQTAEAAMRMGSMIKILALQALAFLAQSDMDQAMSTLERALSLAEPEGFVRTFVDEGAPMARLLQQAAARGIALPYVSGLLAAFGAEGMETATAPSPSGIPPLVEPLTPRELEVLHLLGEGCSNREIAEALVITLNGVKKHTSNIYGKLEVHSRTQAVVRAQELGLL
jgi:LuxR family maltose regulon positive regulatory protein